LLGLLTVLAKSSGPPAFDVIQAATLQMEVRPNGRKEAIEFVWRQPDAALTLSQKQSITAALAKDSDETATLYFLAPLSEQWVGTLKGLLEPTGTFHRAEQWVETLRELLAPTGVLVLYCMTRLLYSTPPLCVWLALSWLWLQTTERRVFCLMRSSTTFSSLATLTKYHSLPSLYGMMAIGHVDLLLA